MSKLLYQYSIRMRDSIFHITCQMCGLYKKFPTEEEAEVWGKIGCNNHKRTKDQSEFLSE